MITQALPVFDVKFTFTFIAELPHAKRASEAPWVRNIGNPSSRENLVMTSPYVRTSVRPSVRTDYGGGEGSLAVTLTGKRKNPYLTGFLKKRKLISVSCQQMIAEVDLTFLRWGCTEAKRKNIIIKITTERQADVTKKIAKDSGSVPGKEAKQ